MLTCTIGSSTDETATPIDWIGAGLIGGAVAVFVFGVIEAPARGWTDSVVWGCMAAGVVLATVFASVQLRRTHPLLDVRLFNRPDFATGAVGITVLFFANFGFFFVEMQYLQLILGYSALGTAFALVPLAVPILLLGATLPLYLPKIGLRTAVAVGLFLLGFGLFCMRGLDADSSFIDMTWPMLIGSAGIGLCVAPTTSAIMSAVPDEKQGVASAVNDTTREVGAAVGIAVAGSVVAARYSDVLGPALADFPDQVRGPALESLAKALTVADRMGPHGTQVAELAKNAFLQSTHLSLLVLSIIVCAAAIFVAVWSPGRDGRQWALIRQLRKNLSGSDDELRGAVADHDDGRVGSPAGERGKHRAVDHP